MVLKRFFYTIHVNKRFTYWHTRLIGVSGKMSTESAGEDDNFGTESSQTLILKILGADCRNRILSGLYMGRSDSALLVRQAALHVWKVVVPNTPRTLREILPTLFSLLLGCLASTSHDKRQVSRLDIIPQTKRGGYIGITLSIHSYFS